MLAGGLGVNTRKALRIVLGTGVRSRRGCAVVCTVSAMLVSSCCWHHIGLRISDFKKPGFIKVLKVTSAKWVLMGGSEGVSRTAFLLGGSSVESMFLPFLASRGFSVSWFMSP